MADLTNTTSSWNSYTWLKILLVFVDLPIGILAFWKNGSKISALFIPVLIIGVIILINSCEPKQAKATIPDLNKLSISNLLMEMEQNVYAIKTSMKDNMEWHASMTKDENVFELIVFPMDAGDVEKIEVTTSNQSGKMGEIKNVLGKIVSFSYKAADPIMARAWLEDNFSKPNSEAVFGRAKFTLDKSTDNVIDLTIEGIAK